MPRAIWSGSISFGLVNIPVKVYNAVTPKNIRFHLLHEKDKSRIRQKRICIAEDKEVPNEELAKGYEISRDNYVVLSDEELEALDPETTRTVDILDFVELPQIDPVYYDSSYYLVPDARSEKPYALLHQAMLKAKRVAVARVVMRDKEYLVALRPLAEGIMMETMHYADEVHPPATVLESAGLEKVKVDEREVKMATQLIDTLSAKFDPEKYPSQHRERIHELIERKAAGEIVTAAAPKPKVHTRAVDLLAQLEKSVQMAKKKVEVEG
jgi:DNA end-binding protein Ku